jgi:hypothetical protein
MDHEAPTPAADSQCRHVVVATHGHCFDGLCSAVMFTRLLRHLSGGTPLRFTYRAVGYGPGQDGVPPEALSGDDNAILDFRFSSSPKLTWYFDHHISAFATPGDRALFDERVAAETSRGQAFRRSFHEATYGSCTKLIADVGQACFDLDSAPMEGLVRWADVIDSASFPSAEMAVARREPELALMTVIEHLGDDAFLAEYVPRLLAEPLTEVATSSAVTEAFGPLKVTHEAFVEKVRKHAVVHGPVVFVDLSAEIVEVAGKFITYALYPASAYSVTLTRSRSKCKISVGYNPWSRVPRVHDIAALCKHYGGGGHPVVGAVALPVSDAEGARRVALELVNELAK